METHTAVAVSGISHLRGPDVAKNVSMQRGRPWPNIQTTQKGMLDTFQSIAKGLPILNLDVNHGRRGETCCTMLSMMLSFSFQSLH